MIDELRRFLVLTGYFIKTYFTVIMDKNNIENDVAVITMVLKEDSEDLREIYSILEKRENNAD